MTHHAHHTEEGATWRDAADGALTTESRQTPSRQIRRVHPVRRPHLRAVALASAFLLAAAGMIHSLPALADVDDGAEHSHDFNADHDAIYQVQRGDRICYSREACGGAAAIPMNTPGLYYMPGGMMPHPPAAR